MKTKLHQLLAVLSDRKGQAQKIITETHVAFAKKPQHFQEKVSTYQTKDEKGDTFPDEHSPMVTTVHAKLDWTWRAVCRWVDIVIQQEMTNSLAKADVVVEGTVILKDVPATALLALEKILKLVRGMLNVIPTYDPSERWDEDPDMGKSIWRAEVRYRQKTKKDMKPVVLYEATEFHPAQVEKVSEDIIIGTWEDRRWSGELSPTQKAEILERLDELAAAVKKARMQANTVKVVALPKGGLAANLFKYVQYGTLTGDPAADEE
jgi:hypothetical protein